MKALILFLSMTGTAWAVFTPFAGSPPADALTAKGNVLTHNGSALVEQAACANGEILEWDSVEADGIKCVTKPVTYPSKAFVYAHGNDASTSTGTLKVMNWNTEVTDTDNAWDGFDEFTAPRAGQYLVSFQTKGDTSQAFSFSVQKDTGGGYAYFIGLKDLDGLACTLCGDTFIIEMNAGDKFRIIHTLFLHNLLNTPAEHWIMIKEL